MHKETFLLSLINWPSKSILWNLFDIYPVLEDIHTLFPQQDKKIVHQHYTWPNNFHYQDRKLCTYQDQDYLIYIKKDLLWHLAYIDHLLLQCLIRIHLVGIWWGWISLGPKNQEDGRWECQNEVIPSAGVEKITKIGKQFFYSPNGKKNTPKRKNLFSQNPIFDDQNFFAISSLLLGAFFPRLGGRGELKNNF